MTFSGQTQFDHRRQEKIAVLITNLGTPDEPTPKALKRYLKQFLSDPRVVEIPRLLWWLILNGIILNVRPGRSARLYQSVWTERGSPLMFHTQDQAEAITKTLAQSPENNNILLRYAMRYGSPSIESVIDEMMNEGATKLLVVPLYPQYAGATTGSTFDAISALFTRRRWLPDFRLLSSYHDDANYIAACAAKIREHWQDAGQPQTLVLSYHGIPKRYLDGGDPYYCQCHKTSRLIAEQLGLAENQYLTTFQSRFGKAEWLQPYTDETLKNLPDKGIKHVDVFCPGFSADCLETLEEIAVENCHYFKDAGGERYHYITALNADQAHIDALADIIRRNLQGWQLADDGGEKRHQLAHRNSLPYKPAR